MSSAPDADIQRAFEDLYVSLYRYACQNVPNVQQHNADDLFWIVTGIPHSMANAVIRSRLEGPSREVAERVAATMAPFMARCVPMEWYLWPTSNPTDLGDHLTTAGLVADGDSPMMAFDLTQSLPTLPPVGARIERVSDQAAFAQWVKVAVDGFGFPESARAIASDLFTMLGYDEPMCQYLTWLDGEPVATTTLLLNGKTAGVFNVATLPAVRGKGIGSAITAHTLREARAAGGHVALLVASAMGEPVYRRLGFQTRGAVTSYLWRPETTE